MKKIWTILMMIILLFALSGCGGKKEDPPLTTTGDGSWTRIADKGELVIGMLDNVLPLQGADSKDNLSGFHVDLANAVCDSMGVKAVFKVIDPASMVSELKSGNIDCIWDSSFVPARDYMGLIFTDAYLNNQTVILSNFEAEIIEPSDIFKYPTSVVSGSQAHVVLLNEDENALLDGKTFGYGTFGDALTALELGDVTVFLSDEITTRYNVPSSTLGSLIHFTDVASRVAVKSGEEDLKDKIQSTINTMISNYRASDIAVKWFGSDRYVAK